MEAEAAAGQAEAADSTTAFCNFVRIKIAFFVSLQKKKTKIKYLKLKLKAEVQKIKDMQFFLFIPALPELP